MAALTAFARVAMSRRRIVPAFVFVTILGGLWLHEVVPRYHVDHLRKRGGRWQDHPSFLIGDCPYYRATLLSLIHDGDLNLKNNLEPRQYQPSENVAQGKHGQWFPKHAILMPIAAIPFYLVAHDRGLIAFNLVQLTGLLMLVWYGARRFTSTHLATAVTFYYAFGTMLRAAAYNFAPDVFSSLLAMGGIVATLSGRLRLAGVVLGLSCWAKWTNVVFVPLPGLYLLARRDLRAAIRYGLYAALPIGVLLFLNYHMFGSAFITPYDRVLIARHGHMVLEPSHRTFFNVPFSMGLWDQLTDRDLGLLVACPPVVLAPLGAALLLRRSPSQTALIVATFAVQLAVFAKYEQWRASSYGPRFLMTSVTVSALLFAPVVEYVFNGRELFRTRRLSPRVGGQAPALDEQAACAAEPRRAKLG